MGKRKKALYPGVDEAEREKARAYRFSPEEMPDFIAGKPNYEKYKGVPADRVLAWLNID